MVFILDCDPVSQVGSSLSGVASSISQISSSVHSYDTSCEDGFDFASAASAIASNIEATSVKVENTAKVIEKVVSTHTALQNRLIGKEEKEEEQTSNNSQEDSYSGGSSSSSYSSGGATSLGVVGSSTISHHASGAITTGWGGDKYTLKGYGEVVALPNDGGMKVNFTDEEGNSLITVKLEEGKDVFYDTKTGDKIDDLGAQGALFSDDTAYLEEMRNKARTNGSDTDWYCIVDRDNFRTTILKQLDGDWRVVKTYDCGTGVWGIEGMMNESHTFTGMWKVDHKSAYDGPNDWWTCFIPYYKPDGTDFGQGFHAGYTGTPEYQSYGCTRLDTYNAKWIFDNVPIGTTVEVF